jgi:hypothetical protein
MVRIALVIFSCLIAILAISSTAARAGDYYYADGYYGDSYYGGSAYSHGGYENGYYGERTYGRYYRYRDDYGYYGPRHGYYGRGPVWYSSSCCYRRVVRYERSVHYAPVYSDRGYYDDGADDDYGWR